MVIRYTLFDKGGVKNMTDEEFHGPGSKETTLSKDQANALAEKEAARTDAANSVIARLKDEIAALEAAGHTELEKLKSAVEHAVSVLKGDFHHVVGESKPNPEPSPNPAVNPEATPDVAPSSDPRADQDRVDPSVDPTAEPRTGAVEDHREENVGKGDELDKSNVGN